MDLYTHGIDDVGRWVTNQLPGYYKEWTDEGSTPRADLDAEDSRAGLSQANFDALSAKFNTIEISSGLPRGDYGQTVRLDRMTLPTVITSNYIWGQTPYEKGRLLHHHDDQIGFDHQESEHRLRDRFIFSRNSGRDPEWSAWGWNELGEAIRVARDLSDITLLLDLFRVRWSTGHVWIEMETSPNAYKKPPLAMYR